MLSNIVIIFIFSMLTTTILVPQSMKLAEKIGGMDYPDKKRKMQKEPMPRLGGVAIVIGFLISLAFGVIYFSLVNNTSINEILDLKQTAAILGGVALIFIMGIIDDTKGMKVKYKLIFQTLAAILVISAGLRIVNIEIGVINGEFNLGNIFSIIITFFWIIGVMNAINLIDGVDGLSSGITLISSISLILIFILNNAPIVALIFAIPFAGSIAGFIPYNKAPAKTYIGDTGTYFLGFMFAVLSILGFSKTYTLLTLIVPIMILIVPIFDTCNTIIRRIVKNKSIKKVFVADRGHIHHRLLDRGFDVKTVVSILYYITFVTSMTSIILLESGRKKGLIFFVLSILLGLFMYKYLLGDLKVNKKNEEYEE